MGLLKKKSPREGLFNLLPPGPIALPGSLTPPASPSLAGDLQASGSLAPCPAAQRVFPWTVPPPRAADRLAAPPGTPLHLPTFRCGLFPLPALRRAPFTCPTFRICLSCPCRPSFLSSSHSQANNVCLPEPSQRNSDGKAFARRPLPSPQLRPAAPRSSPPSHAQHVQGPCPPTRPLHAGRRLPPRAALTFPAALSATRTHRDPLPQPRVWHLEAPLRCLFC